MKHNRPDRRLSGDFAVSWQAPPLSPAADCGMIRNSEEIQPEMHVALLCPTYFYNKGIGCRTAVGPPLRGWQKAGSRCPPARRRFGHKQVTSLRALYLQGVSAQSADTPFSYQCGSAAILCRSLYHSMGSTRTGKPIYSETRKSSVKATTTRQTTCAQIPKRVT